MKKILITLFVLAIGMTAFAQYGPGRRGGGRDFGPRNSFGPSRSFGGGGGYGYFDEGTFEFGMTLNHFTNHKETERDDRVGFFGEYRVYLGPNIDMGAQLSTTFGRGYFSDNTPDGIVYSKAFFWQAVPLVVTDINLMPYSGFNPYAGIGIGPGFGYEKRKERLQTDSPIAHGKWTQSLVVSPRIGIELFERMRMSVQYQAYLSSEGHKFDNVSFGLSWSFPEMMGMGPRRR